MMTKTALGLTILVIVAGIYDLVLVTLYGTGTSISNFLAFHGFNSPLLVFAFGFVMGHLFGYLRPIQPK